MMTGYLLARAGVQVLVLEKHADFFRDFRGDTIHPSTLEVMHELGLLEDLLKLPHQELREIRGIFNGHPVPMADFSSLPTHCKFIAFMPQWDFLNFLAEKAKAFPTFTLQPQHELDDWEKIKLLTVQINRLKKWCRDGLLCIGDNAHAMSPAGGVGINLALQDAVATANLLAEILRDRAATLNELEQVQKRREFPV